MQFNAQKKNENREVKHRAVIESANDWENDEKLLGNDEEKSNFFRLAGAEQSIRTQFMRTIAKKAVFKRAKTNEGSFINCENRSVLNIFLKFKVINKSLCTKSEI